MASRPWGSLTVLAIVVLAAFVAPWIAPFDPTQTLDVVALKNSGPDRLHWLGTDSFSRDQLSRVLYGARTSIIVAMVATSTAIASGTALAATARLLGPRSGNSLMTTADVIRSVPRLLILIAVAAVAGAMPPAEMAVIIGLTASPQIARVIYAQLLVLAARPYSDAAAALGVPTIRVFAYHWAPHLVGPLVAAGVLLMADVMGFESAMSFLGLGVRAPAVSWGSMVQDAMPNLSSAWWVAAVPCTCLLVTVLCTSRIADHLDRARASEHV